MGGWEKKKPLSPANDSAFQVEAVTSESSHECGLCIAVLAGLVLAGLLSLLVKVGKVGRP